MYLQFGSDVGILSDSLNYLNSAIDPSKVKVYGSVFLPSKQLLNRMKFRPWKGLLLSEQFLNSVDDAENIVKQMLVLYKEHNVTPIIETAFRTRKRLLIWKAYLI